MTFNQDDLDAVIAKLKQAMDGQFAFDAEDDSGQLGMMLVVPSDPVLDAYAFLCEMRSLG